MTKTLSVLLAACLFLTACTQRTSVPTKVADEPSGPPEWFTAALPVDGPCGWKTFVPGDLIDLGTSGSDFHASLVTYGGGLAGVTLVVSVADADMQLSATSLPSDGKTTDVTWGSYVSVQITNCAGKYHYQASPLGVVARPGPSACSEGFALGLKPYPFFDSESIFQSGDEQVILATNTSPQGALIHTVGSGSPEVTTFDRGKTETVTVKTLAVRGGYLQVTIKTCGVSFFYKTAIINNAW